MHTPTTSNQNRGTGPLVYYNSAGPDEYLSDLSSCTDNRSDLGSDDYNDYESNYESDNEEATCASTNITTTKSFQYSLRQEKFNVKFSPKDLLNAIREILLSPPRDMSNEKGSLEFLPIYSFLFPNEKGSSLYNAYDRNEVEDKLVIKIDQDGDHAPKFSVADDISEVYGLPGIHECINGQKPLRAVIDIDASQEDMETTGVKAQEVFFRICLSFIRALYRILDCSWEDILNGLVIATSSDSSKCSYHILYAPALLIDHHELKAFTELVYTITGEKFGKFIDQKLPGQNFNLCFIGSAKKGRVKRILQFSLDNGWNELDHVRVQPPPSLGLEVRPRMLSIEKNNNPLRISVGQDILRKYAELVLQKHSSYLRDWTIEEKDSENFVYFNRKAPLGCPLCKRIHDKDQRWFGRVCASSGRFIVKCFRQNSDEPGDVFECDPSIAEKIQQKNKNISSAPSKTKGPGFPKAFVQMPSWAKYNEILTATETYKERYVRPLPNEGDIYVGSPWETGKTYVLEHLTISDDNRGIFPDIDSIIWNKDVPTIRLWVAYMLEKFRSRRLFGWRMVDFLREAGMVISIIEPIPKSEENIVSLSQAVKANSSIVKAEEISDVSNATIVDPLYATYGLKFKAINNKHAHYHLVGSFDSENSPKLPSYQTGDEVYWDNGKDTRYAYSKLTSDELLLEKDSKSSLDPGLVNSAQITEDI
ncbi:hypothetical protein RhiirC2_795920 [Rhizophagus irregularis]|uniref:Replication origin-binding protein domain-containing protein n=1 Tax=Rhizophagus irregularis TaxID=588596 RepID=A0A2N1MAM5_9GLOM|nr:hypothetical protein RhiirC2_795920 [Rhizophagus irregularis]